MDLAQTSSQTCCNRPGLVFNHAKQCAVVSTYTSIRETRFLAKATIGGNAGGTVFRISPQSRTYNPEVHSRPNFPMARNRAGRPLDFFQRPEGVSNHHPKEKPVTRDPRAISRTCRPVSVAEAMIDFFLHRFSETGEPRWLHLANVVAFEAAGQIQEVET
jgi:hypothetical protein